ncbi:hypothetical protein [Falsirhodobacter xinxiangensis]|uniref:hypothetical protein n=1 Tax=Falsirhodobacter xinxiangensis TaxID=2530049 RepID=UPI0010A9D344|nr:hypothetical protein [Rhodobacter xinxiangensis]
MNRRNLLRSAPAAGFAALLVGATPAIAAEQAETPIAAMFREWSALYAFINSDEARGMDDFEWTPQHDRMWRIADDIIEMPAQNAADFVRKVIANTCRGEHGLPDHSQAPALWNEAQALAA